MITVPTESSDLNWRNVLAHHAERTQDKVFTLFEGEATTYGEMAGRAAALAGGVVGRGVGPGDVVVIRSYNCPEFIGALFAANHVGAVATPINWRLVDLEVRHILEPRRTRSSRTAEPNWRGSRSPKRSLFVEAVRRGTLRAGSSNAS